MNGEFIGRVPDRPPLREQFSSVFGPVYVMITRLGCRSTGYSRSSVSFVFCLWVRSVWGGCEAGGGESGLVRLRVDGAGNGEGARCGVCGVLVPPPWA
jgi:hypothetical protein